MHRLNTSELHRLLSIPNPKDETIFGVIGRMEVLLDLFEGHEQYHSLLPFLKTYYYVTKASAEKYVQRRHFFWSLRDYETLDVYFASLYFKPLLAFLVEGIYDTPWKTYYSYCRKKEGIPFLQMILGINAHINGDLYTALVNLHYKHEKDFFLVNNILQEVFPEVMNFMVFSEHDIFSIGGLVMRKYFLSQFHTVIEKWRSQAWINAHYMNKLKRNHEYIARTTEQIGSKLIYDFETVTLLPELPELLDNINGPAISQVRRQV